MTLATVATLLSPPAARVSPYFLMVIRFINGAGQVGRCVSGWI